MRSQSIGSLLKSAIYKPFLLFLFAWKIIASLFLSHTGLKYSAVPSGLEDKIFKPEELAFDNFISYILSKMREGEKLAGERFGRLSRMSPRPQSKSWTSTVWDSEILTWCFSIKGSLNRPMFEPLQIVFPASKARKMIARVSSRWECIMRKQLWISISRNQYRYPSFLLDNSLWSVAWLFSSIFVLI